MYQIWDLVGVWFAGLATTFAAVVALLLARRLEKVRLKVFVGTKILLGSRKPQYKLLCIDVTNLGDWPVSINGVGWRIGKRNKKRNSMQTLTHPASNKFPVKLSYGESANFQIQVDDGWRKNSLMTL